MKFYLIWYSFYGQFEFLNFCVLWALDLNNKCGVYGNPLQQTISFGGSQDIPTLLFMFSGLLWDAVIYLLLFKKKDTPGMY